MDKHVSSMLLRIVGAFAAAILTLTVSVAHAQPIAAGHAALRMAGEVILGGASFYDTPGESTASGEQYDPDLFTAAAQLELRHKFGGIRFGRLYEPAYAVAEYAGKRAILKFNDVGPLKPGRKFDLSVAAMKHFGGLGRGVLAEFKVTLLPPGKDYTPGPLPDIAWTPIESNGEPLVPVRDHQVALAATADGPGATASIHRCLARAKLVPLRIETAGLVPELTIADVMLGGPEEPPRPGAPLQIATLGN